MKINLDAFAEFTDVVLKSDKRISIYQYELLESVLKVILDFNKAEISVCLDRDLRLYRHLCKEMPKKIRCHNYMCCFMVSI